MRPGTHIEIEIEAADGTQLCEPYRTVRADEAFDFAKGNLQPGITIVLACLGSGVDYGNFIIEATSPSSCNLRALEHRGFCVSCVSVEQALDALEYWLPQQERTPSLSWQDE